VDIEVVTDHAIIGTMYKLAEKHGIKYILSGSNIVTEHVLPSHWMFNKTDDINIKDIHRRFGSKQLKSYPFFSFKERRYYTHIKRIETVSLLNYMPFDVADAKKAIINELGWRDYGGKHYESIFTRFYQGYILPVKFKIDKRKAHFSNLIFSGQITRDLALRMLKQPIYDPRQFVEDKEFVLKKLNLAEKDFKVIMQEPRREHREFKYIRPVLEQYPFLKAFKPLWRLVKRKG
jgi:hypothetical protein